MKSCSVRKDLATLRVCGCSVTRLYSAQCKRDVYAYTSFDCLHCVAFVNDELNISTFCSQFRFRYTSCIACCTPLSSLLAPKTPTPACRRARGIRRWPANRQQVRKLSIGSNSEHTSQKKKWGRGFTPSFRFFSLSRSTRTQVVAQFPSQLHTYRPKQQYFIKK